MSTFSKHIACTALFFIGATTASGQQAGDCKGDLSYEHHNQVDYGPLKFNKIRGVARDPAGVPISGACVIVFIEDDHKMVANTETDGEGAFHFDFIPAGRYRVVAKLRGFCAANVPIIIRNPRKKGKRLMIHLVPPAIDVCSYGAYK